MIVRRRTLFLLVTLSFFVVVLGVHMLFRTDRALLQQKLIHIARIQKAYQQLTHAMEGEEVLLTPEKSTYLESLFKLRTYQAEYDRDFLMLTLKQTLLSLGFTLLLSTWIKRLHHGEDRRRSRFPLLYLLFIGGLTYLLLFFMLNRITIAPIY